MYILKMDAKLVQDREDILQLQIVLGLVLGFGVIISLLVSYIVRIKNDQLAKRHKLLNEIQKLKTDALTLGITNKPSGPLDRKLLEASLGRTLNDTDWKVLNILIENPTITNFEIAEQTHMSIDGIGSSLRRMYQYFDVKETKYKKIALLHTAFTRSKSGSKARG
jgi:DNA-binding CsgD family transcriptional regulator